jgi:hypothetical protein
LNKTSVHACDRSLIDRPVDRLAWLSRRF